MEAKKIIIIGDPCGLRSIRLAYILMQQNGTHLVFKGTTAKEAAEAMERFVNHVDSVGKTFNDFIETLEDFRDKNFSEKPRGVIPSKFKNNVHLRKPAKK